MARGSSTKDDVMAGAFAGACARLVTAPFDVLKIRFQLQFAEKVKYTSLSQAFRTVVQEEGIVGLWKGNVAATYLWISYAMIQFGVYGFLKKSLETLPDPFDRRPLINEANLFSQKKNIDFSPRGIKENPPQDQNTQTAGYCTFFDAVNHHEILSRFHKNEIIRFLVPFYR